MSSTRKVVHTFYCKKLDGPIDVTAIYDITTYENGLYSEALRPIKPNCDCCSPRECPLVVHMKEFLRQGRK